MPRYLRLDQTGPVKIEPVGKPISICACGLSRTFPFCDGTHKTTTRLEQPGLIYFYDPQTLAVIRTEPDDQPPPAAPPQNAP